MQAVVVDASVILAWSHAGDSRRDAAARAIGSRVSLVAPSIIEAEVGNGLWLGLHTGRGNVEAARTSLANLPRYVRLESYHTLSMRALDIALALDHPIYDCYYLALAEREATRVVTFDERL